LLNIDTQELLGFLSDSINQ